MFHIRILLRCFKCTGIFLDMRKYVLIYLQIQEVVSTNERVLRTWSILLKLYKLQFLCMKEPHLREEVAMLYT